jgi:hypothetical protein
MKFPVIGSCREAAGVSSEPKTERWAMCTETVLSKKQKIDGNGDKSKKEVKTVWIQLGILSVGLFLFALYGIASNPMPQNPQKVRKQYDKLQLFRYFPGERYQPSAETIKEQYAICPPLLSERFRRRVKILWGIDVNDYPENAFIE